ncbi:NAD(P)H-dependent FMN reductase [Enemella evansiae]|nr:NAD(P)H-dependent FMN reductase [Enemella evansiae]
MISSSVRTDRMCPTIADWVTATLSDVDGVEVDLIDLAETTLPDDSLLYPGGGPKTEVADRIEAAEAFVFVTPEYNHSYPASLKRLIDWHYDEWVRKPAMIVAYGVRGGYAAIEHLRGVLAELSIVTTRRAVGLSAPWEVLDDAECYRPAEDVTQGLRGALAELDWWAGLLTDARANRPFPN